MKPTDRTTAIPPAEFPFQVGHKVRLQIGADRYLAEVYQPPKNDKVTVIWYNGPGLTEKKTVALSAISLAPLISQQRVYIEPGDFWQHGRIVCERDRPRSSRLRLYTIALPGGEKTELFEDQFHVHSDVTHPDPFDALAGLATETPFLCEHRSRFVKALVEQRAVCAGMTGLMAARIDLIPHQIDVARRILQDPRQRYLLADEVGLGKTIESGIIIRQLVQDDPAARVLVLAPPHLVAQWKAELRNRFDLDTGVADEDDAAEDEDDEDEPKPRKAAAKKPAARRPPVDDEDEEEDDEPAADADAGDDDDDDERRIEVRSHDEIGSIKQAPELLVIDEAHHLVRGDARRRKLAEKLCTKSPRLLLLSATPVLGQERELLTLLSWLEPHLYSVDDEAAFTQRVRERQTIGNELLLLRPGMPALRLKSALKRLQQLFDGQGSRLHDPVVLGLCEELLALCDAAERDQPLIDRKIVELRLHISECYRLHRRLIRHRRRGLQTALSRRELARHEGDLDPDRSGAVHIAFDQWRDHVAFHARELGDAERRAWEALFGELLQALVHPPWAAELIKARLKPGKRAKDDEPALHAVGRVPLCEGEEKFLKELSARLKQLDAASDRMALLCMLFKGDAKRFPRIPKTVIFTRSRAVAQALAERIRTTVFVRVGLVVGTMTPEEMAAQVAQFRTEAASSILICDATGSEGLNLQIAERLVHFDLPLDPFAIEQRIGRLDRLTRVAARVPNIVITSQGEPPAFDDAWLAVLRDGFNLFGESISDLNLYADRRLPDLLRQGFQDGVQAWLEVVPALKAEIEAERLAIDSQDAIDAVDLNPEATEQLTRQLTAFEADLTPFIDAVNSYLKQLNRIDVFRLQKAQGYQQHRWHALDNVLMREDWYDEIAPHLLKPFQYDRSEAQREPGSLFLRLGHPLIDRLNRFAMRDDRGKAFILWRPIRGYAGSDLFFRIDVVVEAAAGTLEAGLREVKLPPSRQRELSRLADSFFPPRVQTYYLDEELQIVTDAPKLGALRRVYDKRTGDRNIARGRVQALVDEIGRARWANTVTAVRGRVLELIQQAPAHRGECDAGARRAHRYFAQRIDQVKLGARHVDRAELQATLSVEEALQAAMEAAIRTPTIRIDAAGCVLLSGKPCPELPGDED